MPAEILEHPSDGLLRWSISRLAREFGMARETVAGRIASNGIKANGKQGRHDTYLLRDAAPAILDATRATSIDPESENFEPGKLPPKERKDFYDSERLRLQVEKEMALLVPAHEFRAELAAVCKAVAIFMETLPDILERDCGLDPATIQRIQDAADEQRAQLADKVEALEL